MNNTHGLKLERYILQSKKSGRFFIFIAECCMDGKSSQYRDIITINNDSIYDWSEPSLSYISFWETPKLREGDELAYHNINEVEFVKIILEIK